MVKVSIIVSVDGSFEMNNNFFEHLFSLNLPDGYEIITITDGVSNQAIIKYLSDLAQSHDNFILKILRNKVGIGIANNTAVKESKGELLLFINNDVFFQVLIMQ